MSRVSNTFSLLSAVALVALSSAAANAQPWSQGGSSARVEITPKETEVYVDGYLVGTSDDFDGFTQRLRVPPGEHELEFFLEGHRSIREKIFFQPGETYRIRHRMEPLESGDTAPTRPRPDPNAIQSAPPPDVYGRPLPRRDDVPRGTAASLSIRVQPTDAEILIDGERWQSSNPLSPLIVQVSDGAHRIEVRKEGYKSFSTTVEVRAGEVVPVNISLSPQ